MLWDALVHDVAAEVLLLSTQGKILFANPEAEAFFQTERGGLVGAQYRDLLPEAVGAERLGYISEVVRSGKRLVVEGVIKGSWRQTSIRQILGSEPHVLLVNRAGATGSVAPERPKDHEPAPRGDRLRAKNDDLGALAALTTREREILALIGRGFSTVEIAKNLGRSVKTIEWHRVSLGNKLGVANRVELAHIALRAGLAQIETPPIKPQGAEPRSSKPERN